MEIRRFELSDLDKVFELLNVLYNGKIEYEAFNKRYLMKLKDLNSYNIVAVENENIVGILTSELQVKLHRNNSELFIEDFIVEEQERNKGIGKRLLDEAILFAQNNHCEVVELTSYKENTRAHRFYEKNGFISHSIDFKKYLLK